MLELIDAFTSDIIRNPVLAADGHVYDRASLAAFFGHAAVAQLGLTAEELCAL